MKRIIQKTLLFTSLKFVRKYVGGNWSLLYFKNPREDFSMWVSGDFNSVEKEDFLKDNNIVVLKTEKWGGQYG